MRIYDNLTEIQGYLNQRKRSGDSIGLVPTMGALHEGHMSLINAARACDVVVVSIFVNPLQFNMAEDLKKYPRQLAKDKEFLKDRCDVLFVPTVNEMYKDAPKVSIDFGSLGSILEGEFRPGHFNGVGVVVAKLINIIQPDTAYFGLKDLQQFLLIRQMVTELSMPVNIVGCPIIRESTGLAMSSRNVRLSDAGRVIATEIFKGLQMARQLVKNNCTISETKSQILGFYRSVKGLEVEYFEFVDDSMIIQSKIDHQANIAVCVAAYVEGVRLIDNLYLRSEN
jgi:pantoate--beta-alanine ligase